MMKRLLYLWTPILFFLLMFLFPAPVFQGARNGLLLWFNTVLPTLLPFMIVSDLLVSTRAIHGISRAAGIFLRPMLGVSDYGAYTVLAGFLCGYPMGSKVTSDLLRSGRIHRSEGGYLLSFCNNTSPMFVVSFVVLQNLKTPQLAVPALAILWISALICGILFRRRYFPEENHFPGKKRPLDLLSQGRLSIGQFSHGRKSSPGEASSRPGILDACIMNGFEAITKIGGYIMLFSICMELLQLVPFRNTPLFQAVLASLEITNGIALICGGAFPISTKFILCMALSSFGGWCSVAQTQCMIRESRLPLLPYIAQKLVTMIVTSLIAFIYLLLFPLGNGP